MPNTHLYSFVEIYRGQKVHVEVSDTGIVAFDNYWQPIHNHTIDVYLNNRQITAEVKRRAEKAPKAESDTIGEIYRNIVRQMIDEWLFSQ